MSKTTCHTPHKIVIVAGPSFGQALKFMILGAAVGAGAIHYLRPKKEAQPPRGAKGAVQDMAGKFLAAKFDPHKAAAKQGDKPGSTTAEMIGEAVPAEGTAEMADRLGSLTSRLKSIGSRAKQLVQTAGEAVKPTLETAIAEGKRVAAEVQTNLKKDVAEAGDSPAIAEQDGELPSEKEDKFIE